MERKMRGIAHLIAVGAITSSTLGQFIYNTNETFAAGDEAANNEVSDTVEFKKSEYKWYKGTLSVSYPPELAEHVDIATKMWSEAGNITFIEGDKEDADIRMTLESDPAFEEQNPSYYAHGVRSISERYPDSYMLSATRFFSDKFYSLPFEEQVALVLHELGHSIGLDHPENSESAMSIGFPKSKLSQDDIDGIQSLYGAPLEEGWNWVEWKADDTNPNHYSFKAVYSYRESKWSGWSNDAPAYSNDLHALRKGEMYWILK